MNIKAVIFDLDGTIIDSEYYFVRRTMNFAKENGFSITYEDALKGVGFSYHNYLSYLSKLLNMEKAVVAEMFEEYKSVHPISYKELMNRDAFSLLDYLKDTPYRIALASSTYRPVLDDKLNQIGLTGFFEVEMSGDMLKRTKPDPEIYFECARRLNLHPSECIAIEDSKVGIRAAHDAGMKVIARRDSHFETDQSLADWIVDDLRKVIEILK